MKALAIWFGILGIVFGALFAGYHLMRSANPAQVFVVVDSSYEMQQVWRRVPAALDEIDGRRYAQFALATEKGIVHGWSDELNLGPITPYAPRDLSAVGAFPESNEAAERILITNAAGAATTGLADWSIVRLEP
jgi:hypothetical protein